MERKVSIEGMSCEGCSRRIQNLLNRIPGVISTVSLSDKEAVVSSPESVTDDELREAIAGAGFEVTGIAVV